MESFDSIKSELPYYQEIILYYKTNPCQRNQQQKTSKTKIPSGQCDQNSCFNYHTFQERRRAVFLDKTYTLAYEPVWCSHLLERGICPNEDQCQYAHTQNEINYHPLYYKTEPCGGCAFIANPNMCCKYHLDEVSRSLILERCLTKKSKEATGGHPLRIHMPSREFNIDTFKTIRCTVKGNHNPKVCVCYHFDKDRRRSPREFLYSPTICYYISRNQICPRGDNCEYSHNKVEQLYHPEKYKKKFCLYHPHNLQKCDYGNYCSFAHSESEIQIELLHNLQKDTHFYVNKYKTVYCPYIYEHDRNQCIYAHNPQDFRRSPLLYKYEPSQCPNWVQGQVFSYEEGNCPKQMDCNLCHGWKEIEYHPLCYKTKLCNNAKNCIKIDCPFVHSEKELINRSPLNKLTEFNQPSIQSLGPNTDQKQAPLILGSGEKITYYDPFKKSSPFKKESHFPGAIIPPWDHFYGGNREQLKYKSASESYQFEGSTRPNSSVSSQVLPDDSTHRSHYNKKKKKKQGYPNPKYEESKHGFSFQPEESKIIFSDTPSTSFDTSTLGGSGHIGIQLFSKPPETRVEKSDNSFDYSEGEPVKNRS